MQPPLFVVGAPRSGTTYLVEVLNRHPDVLITNETRVMTFLNRVLHGLGQEDFVLQEERQRVLLALRRGLPNIVRDLYQDLGADDHKRWGDKFPHYADSKTDPQLLDLIDEFFPRSQLIHIVRDGRDVVASLTAKGWVDLPEAIDVWHRHVTHARGFGLRIGLDRYFEIRYDRLVDEPLESIAELLRFLHLPLSSQVETFLKEQACSRTPFSRPTVDTESIGQPSWRQRLSEDAAAQVERELADLLVEFEFEDYGWRRRVRRTSMSAVE